MTTVVDSCKLQELLINTSKCYLLQLLCFITLKSGNFPVPIVWQRTEYLELRLPQIILTIFYNWNVLGSSEFCHRNCFLVHFRPGEPMAYRFVGMGWVSLLECCPLVRWDATLPPTCLVSGAAVLTQHPYKSASQSLTRQGSITLLDMPVSKAPQRKEWLTHHRLNTA